MAATDVSKIGDLHISQFNVLFQNNILSNAVLRTKPLEYRDFRLQFEGLEIHKPYSIGALANPYDKRLLPRDCRERSTTYGGSCFLKVRLEYKERVLFDDYKQAGIFPIMVKSDMCHLADVKNLHSVGEDPSECGGYFIINGYDKLLRFHIGYKRNSIFVTKKKSKDPAYTEYGCMIRSVGPDEIGQKNELKYCTDGNVHVKLFLNRRGYTIPIILILQALANTTDEEIYRNLGCDRRVLSMLGKMKEHSTFSRREALHFLGNRFRPVLRMDNPEECGAEFLRRTLLIHLERPEDKYNMLIDAVRRLLMCVDGKITPDNIDLPSSHELYTEAQLIPLGVREKLEEIKKSLYTKILGVIRKRVATGDSTTTINTSEAGELSEDLTEAQIGQIGRLFDALDFNIGLKISKFLSTGNITTASCSDILQNSGFTILAERINFWRFASHFQSVSRGAFFETLKISTIRKLRPESWGFLCPLHTPDGSPCGVLLHLAAGCHIIDRQNDVNPLVFYEYGLMPVLRVPSDGARGAPLYFNGRLLGTTDTPTELARRLREFRGRHGLCLEICHEHGPGVCETISVSDGIGSMMRRVLNLRTGVEEWIGIKEQVFLNIRLAEYVTKDNFNEYDRFYNGATHDQTESESIIHDQAARSSTVHDYAEIDNQRIFSSVAACIPFAEYNPSPRNIYQCQMAKQAMGLPAYNLRSRTDNKLYWVNYLQTPSVKTDSYDTFAKYPLGFNCMVAVLSYTAYDMEDAVVINKSAKERGLFSASIYKTEKFELEKNSVVEYTPSRGSLIKAGDTLLKYHSEDRGQIVQTYHGPEDGAVDCVRVFNNGLLCVSITVRIERNPSIGDKFCSRHGQKGVLSRLWPEVDMPFTEQGLRPDIIVNPHAFPSRMTIGMLLESMCGKTALALGKEQDATPFLKRTFFEEDVPGSIGEELRKCGFNYYGNEPMYSGTAGTEFRTDIFFGNVYYQRLRHMVNDKYQVRTSGAVVATTRQPVGGRKNKGGIRFGEMERDALIAHGTAFLLKDRLMDCSDRTAFLYCESCRSILFCSQSSCLCGGSRLKTIEMPFVFKYLCTELLAMNIKVGVTL